jgi:hypothetical protein
MVKPFVIKPRNGCIFSQSHLLELIRQIQTSSFLFNYVNPWINRLFDRTETNTKTPELASD